VAVTGAVAVGANLWLPATRPYLAHEGGIVENLSAVFYLFGFLGGIWACRDAPRDQVPRRYLAIPLLSAVSFFDEIGDGIFPDPPPHVYGLKVTSLHEFAHVAVKLWQDAPGSLQAASLIGIAILGLLFAWRFGPQLLALVRGESAYRFVMLWFALGAVALVLDADKGDVLTFYEELLEMNAALALLFAAAMIPTRGAVPAGLRLAFWICLVLASVAGLVFA
jgi:hypothetical protein